MEEEGWIWCEQSDFFEEAQHRTVLFFQQNEYRGSANLYPESLEGDEPEPLPQVRWPLAHVMDLLEDPDQRSA
ncbi:hypothetical protein ACNKHR_15200 [Shigella flexneri]